MESETSFEFRNESGIMRGFQNGITLVSRTSRSALKVYVYGTSGYMVGTSGYMVGCWKIESICLPTEAFRDFSVTLTLLVRFR